MAAPGAAPAYRRVLLKISGEALAGGQGYGIDPDVIGRIAGVLIAVSGLFMMLPFPLPFSNSLPAWTVIFLAAAAMRRDGLFFLIGCGSFGLSVAFFTAVALGGVELFDWLAALLFTPPPGNLTP